MTPPLVSVIIPSYRAARYLGEALASVQAQTHPAWEILVYEDGVFDDTADQVKKFSATATHPVRFFQSETNRGVSCARNALLDAVRGDFIAFLDADDTWTPDHLAHSLACIEEEKSDWIIGGTNFLDPSGVVVESGVLPEILSAAAIPTRLLTYNFILTGGVVARAAVFTRGLRFDPQLTVGEDLDLWIRIVAAGNKTSFSRRATFNYRKHPTSTTADPVRFPEEFSRLFERYLGDAIVDQRLCQERVRTMLTSVARMTWRRDPRRALDALRRLFRVAPWHVQAWPFFIMAKASQLTSS